MRFRLPVVVAVAALVATGAALASLPQRTGVDFASTPLASGAARAVASPNTEIAQAQKQWLNELRASAETGDRSADFPSPPRAVLLRRLDKAQKLYGFQIVRVRMLHPFQSAPVIVIRSDNKRAIAKATPKIVNLFDPIHVTSNNPSGYAYEGYFFSAIDNHGVPYLATFNPWRAPHLGGGEWAASADLYPFPHG
jgi:hypothetical protein